MTAYSTPLSEIPVDTSVIASKEELELARQIFANSGGGSTGNVAGTAGKAAGYGGNVVVDCETNTWQILQDGLIVVLLFLILSLDAVNSLLRSIIPETSDLVFVLIKALLFFGIYVLIRFLL